MQASQKQEVFDVECLGQATFDKGGQRVVVAFIESVLQQVVRKLSFKSKLDCANCLHICHKKYSVWALALKAIRLWQWVGY